MKIQFIDFLCPPALLYVLYTTIHVGLDLSLGMYMTALIKAGMGVAGAIILDALCSVDLGIVSWAIVATPFIMVALASSISLGLGIDRLTSQVVKETFKSKDEKKKENFESNDKKSDLPKQSNEIV
jgi:uncharacterized membrane protein YhiD involved in acid resistance